MSFARPQTYARAPMVLSHGQGSKVRGGGGQCGAGRVGWRGSGVEGGQRTRWTASCAAASRACGCVQRRVRSCWVLPAWRLEVAAPVAPHPAPASLNHHHHCHCLSSPYSSPLPPPLAPPPHPTQVYDVEGREYLDMAAGIAVNALGHTDPRWLAALQEQAGLLAHTSNLYHTAPQVT